MPSPTDPADSADDVGDFAAAADPVVPFGYAMRAMEGSDLPAVHALETRLFPLDAWPLSFFEEELAHTGPEHDGGTRAYRVLLAEVPPHHALWGQSPPVGIAPKAGEAGGAGHAGEAGGADRAREGAGVVLGYCGLMCVPPLADVQTIAVSPEAEGRGLGTVMLQWMVAEAGRRRARDLLLEVREDNPRAQALYVRHGFEHVHTRAGYYPGDPRSGSGRVDALIMRRRLVG